MPDSHVLRELEAHLRRHGLARARLERIMGEMRAHWEEGRAAALREGLPADAASLRADAQLGEPGMLARSFAAQLRRACWLGRHPWLGLALLPTLLFLAHGFLLALPAEGLWALTTWWEEDFWRQVPFTQLAAAVLWIAYGLATALVQVTLAWWCWRAGLGTRFLGMVSVSCLAAALFRSFDVDSVQRTVTLAVRFQPGLDAHSLFVVAVHLGVGGLILATVRRRGRPPTPSLGELQAYAD